MVVTVSIVSGVCAGSVLNLDGGGREMPSSFPTPPTLIIQGGDRRACSRADARARLRCTTHLPCLRQVDMSAEFERRVFQLAPSSHPANHRARHVSLQCIRSQWQYVSSKQNGWSQYCILNAMDTCLFCRNATAFWILASGKKAIKTKTKNFAHPTWNLCLSSF